MHRVEREEVGYKMLTRLVRLSSHSGGNTFHGENMRVTMFAKKGAHIFDWTVVSPLKLQVFITMPAP